MTHATKVSRRWLLAAALLVSIIFGEASAQSWAKLSHIGSTIRTREIVSNLSGPTSSTEAVVLTGRKTDVWTGDDWSLESRSLLAYEGVRRIENSEYQWFENGEFGIQNRTTYTHSDLGFLIELREQWNLETQEFEPIDRYTYFFASDGKTIKTAFYDLWIGTEFRPAERTSYTLDENLLLTGGEVSDWDGTSWHPTERFTLTHDGANVTQIDERWNGVTWENATRTVFQSVTISQLYQMVEKFSAAFEDYAGLNYGVRFLPPMGVMEWNGATWVNVERTVHDMYDVFTEQVMRILYLEWNVDRWVPAIAHHFEYDTATRQPTQIELKVFDGEATWSTVLMENYEIDSMGDVASVLVQYDFGAGLEPAARIEFYWMHIPLSADEDEMPTDYRLEAAYPNPFNPSTTIAFETRVTSPLTLRIFDTLGREVSTLVDGVQAAGRHEIAFRADGLPSGQYFVRLEAPGFEQTRLVTLIK